MKYKVLTNLRLTGFLFAAMTVLASAGCGGGMNQAASNTNAPASSAPVTVTIGDAPLSGVLAFEVTVNNISLTSASGTVTVLSVPTEIEVSHLAGTFAPLTLVKVPTGTYTQMSVTLGAAEVLFIPQGGTIPIHQNIPAPAAPVNITLAPPIVISAGASSLNLDLNVANSLSIDASNKVTFTPSFTVANKQIGAEGQQEDEDGEADDLKGTFASFSGSQFTIKVGGGTQTLTIDTNSSTIFDPQNLTLSTIPLGTVIQVDASTQANGSLLAKKVEVESENQLGMEAEGLVTSVTGSPATSFQLVTQEVTAPTPNAPNLGNTVTVNLGTNPTFRVHGIGNLTIPSGLTFSSTTLAPGQRVEADADLAGAVSFTANRVQLKEEAVDGTIAALSGTTFQLTLDPNSTLAKLSGATTINVSAASAENKIATALANGQIVRVRGLLFFTPATATTTVSYTLIARQIRKP